MRRMIVLGVVMAVGLFSLIAVSAQQEEMVVEVEQLEDNLYVLRGGGGHTAAFVTSDGVVLVDTKVAGWGQPLLDAVGALTSNPVTTIINTHAHFDHVSGNVEFPASVAFVAHENAKPLMEEWNPVTGFPGDFPDVFDQSDGHGLPTRTFSDRLTLGSGADQVDLYYFGRGHTSGDAWVVFPSLRTMHAGDMFAGKNLPIIDANNGGSGVEYPETLRRAHRSMTDIDTIITGHSTQMTRDDLAEYARFVGSFVTSVMNAKTAGQTAEEVASSWEVPARFPGYGRGVPGGVSAWVQAIFDELE